MQSLLADSPHQPNQQFCTELQEEAVGQIRIAVQACSYATRGLYRREPFLRLPVDERGRVSNLLMNEQASSTGGTQLRTCQPSQDGVRSALPVPKRRARGC